MDWITVASFLGFTALVAVLTWLITRRDDHSSSSGYFLAGRSLSFPLIAGSLLLTNLSTEQLVALNGDAYLFGLAVMVWEVVAVIALVFMAWFFLPRFLKSGVATVPEFLALRHGESTQLITNVIFLVAYIVILLPLILFSGAVALVDILAVPAVLGPYNPLPAQLSDRMFCIIAVEIVVGVIGSIYALFGGLRTVAVSDTLNGIGLLAGGFLITGYALSHLGGGDLMAGAERVYESQPERFNSIGSTDTNVPFGAIFAGIFLLNLFYWTTNQQIIQRTFAASSLAEGQKGVLLCGLLKLFGPLYLVLPGMIAYTVFAGQGMEAKFAYGSLVNLVLPKWLNGFFAAVLLGAILSSFNSALNSSCTLFSLGLYKGVLSRDASDRAVVNSGKYFGWFVAILAMAGAPLLDRYESLFEYLQKMNAIYFIPIFAVVLVGMCSRRVPKRAADVALIGGVAVLIAGNFIPPFNLIAASMGDFYFVGIVFGWLVVYQLIEGELRQRDPEYVQVDVRAVDMTSWRLAKPVGIVLITIVIAIYASFADFNVLTKRDSPDDPSTTQKLAPPLSAGNLPPDAAN